MHNVIMMSIILLSFSPLRRVFTFRSISIVIILLLTIQIIFLHFVFNIFDGTHLVYQSRQFVENITCDIKDKQAISALKRMKTEKCRQRCIDVYCLIGENNKNKSWPDELQNRCNHYGNDKFKWKTKLIGSINNCNCRFRQAGKIDWMLFS